MGGTESAGGLVDTTCAGGWLTVLSSSEERESEANVASGGWTGEARIFSGGASTCLPWWSSIRSSNVFGLLALCFFFSLRAFEDSVAVRFEEALEVAFGAEAESFFAGADVKEAGAEAGAEALEDAGTTAEADVTDATVEAGEATFSLESIAAGRREASVRAVRKRAAQSRRVLFEKLRQIVQDSVGEPLPDTKDRVSVCLWGGFLPHKPHKF